MEMYGQSDLPGCALRRGSMDEITYESFIEVVTKEYVRFERIEDPISIFAKVRAGGALVSPNLVKGFVCLGSSAP